MGILLRIYGVVLIFVVIKYLEAKALDRYEDEEAMMHERAKRGYSKYGQNDYATSIQVSSGVLQFASPAEHSSIDTSSQYANDGWKSAQSSPSYEVWLEPSQNYQPSPPHDISTTSISSAHSGSDQLAKSVFSTDTHLPHVELPSHQMELHTQISSSSSSGISSGHIDDGDIDIGHHHQAFGSGGGTAGDIHISDNIDFNNIADIKSKHYAKSYGK